MKAKMEYLQEFQRRSTVIAALVLFIAALSVPSSTLAQIENEAVATGEHGGEPVVSEPVVEEVPVAVPNPALAVTLSPPEFDDLDGSGSVTAGDVLNVSYRVVNSGNISFPSVELLPDRPRFGDLPGENEMQSVERLGDAAGLPPGEVAEFTGRYILTEVDIYRAAGLDDGVSISAKAVGVRAGAQPFESAAISPARMIVPARPGLVIEKSHEFVTDNGVAGAADAGDVILYRYRVTNNGNVAIQNVTITDMHEGEPVDSSRIVESDADTVIPGPLGVTRDSTGQDGRWDVLGPGATIAFTYTHTVTQAEFDAQ